MEFTEHIKTTRVDNVILRKVNVQAVEGTLCLTSHLLLFSSRSEERDELMLSYSSVEHVHRKFTNTHGVLTFLCKDFTSFKLRIPGAENASNIATSVETLSTLENPSLYYPFFYRLDFEITIEGWDLYPLSSENNKVLKECGLWRISHVNKDFKVCPSYPEALVVPLAASDDVLVKSSKFRMGGRFLVLSYLHGKDMVPLMRCSQPLNGPGNKRCKEDEKLLNFALSGHGKKGMIIDTRVSPSSSSQRTRGVGTGYEVESNYPQWKKSYQSIDRFSSLSDYLSKLRDACTDTKNTGWLSKLDNSNWLGTVDAILSTAMYVTSLIANDKVPVLVHGDGGTDMTLAITALCQVLLDPICRTIDGFQSLIVREWLYGGHPFSSRNIKLGISPSRYKGQGPVFLLFLDSIHQVLRQYPCSFEFNEDFLLFLSEHSYASPYGTFLLNNEKERSHCSLKSRTISVWSYLGQKDVKKKFLNVLYERNLAPLMPSNAPQSLRVWDAMFLKWTRREGYDSEKTLYENVRRVKDKNIDLKLEACELQRQHEELRQILVRSIGEKRV